MPSVRTATMAATVAATVATVIVAGTAGAAPHTHHHGAARVTGYRAEAYGSDLEGGSASSSGRSASVPLGCTSRSGVTHSNHTNATKLGPLGHIGAVQTTVSSRDASGGAPQSTSRSDTTAARLLGGAVDAREIVAQARMVQTASGLKPIASTTIGKLTIDGKSHKVDGKKNQSFAVPGIGKLVVNQQSVHGAGAAKSVTVQAMRLLVTKNSAASAVKGAKLVIGHVTAGLTPPTSGLLAGGAYGTKISLAGQSNSGPTFRQILGCAGTGGKTIANTGSAETPAQAQGAQVASAVSGTLRPAPAATTKSTVHHANLLDGIVTARLLKAVAHASRGSGSTALSHTGSRIAGLKIDGHSYAKSIKPNQAVKIPGVGRLVLEKVTKHARSQTVNMLDLVLSRAHGSLPKGSEITAGTASVGIHR